MLEADINLQTKHSIPSNKQLFVMKKSYNYINILLKTLSVRKDSQRMFLMH